jgi:phosphocarrier protein FPr
VLERKVVVRVSEGLHARPAADFVKLARGFKADLEIVCGDKNANAKSAVKLMLLGVREGDEIALRAEGDDALEALETLSRFMAGSSDVGVLGPNGSEAGAGAPQHPPRSFDQLSRPPRRGAPASEGVVLAPAFAFFPEALARSDRVLAPHEMERELSRLRAALSALAEELSRRKRSASPGSEDDHIVDALTEIARDDALLNPIEAMVREGRDVVSAALAAGDSLADQFGSLAGDYQRGRGDDIRAVARQIALAALGKTGASLRSAPAGAIVLAEELSAFDLAGAPLDRIAGIVCIKGAATSHVAIMARAHGVPAVLGFPASIEQLGRAKVVALDGATGEVFLDPDPAVAAAFQARIASDAETKRALQAYADATPRTRTGKLIEVAANIGSLEEIDAALAVGAMGVGLFRTEFLFMARKRPPSEDEQAEVYEKLAAAFAPRPVIVRTLDIGGDKPAPGIDFPHEDNPFLGWRGVRMCLDRPDIFKPQLRALLRAARIGNIKVMAPMIAEVEEVRQVKALIDECRRELEEAGVAQGAFDFGIMVETPAAALLAEELAREVRFFSIGTNDLTQYVMAADRLNARVARLNRPDHPAVLAAIRMVCDAARKTGVWVGICGEAAARPDLIPTFVAMGVSELSMSPAAILRAKKCIIEL